VSGVPSLLVRLRAGENLPPQRLVSGRAIRRKTLAGVGRASNSVKTARGGCYQGRSNALRAFAEVRSATSATSSPRASASASTTYLTLAGVLSFPRSA
jgi:hypothetical protein